MFAGVTSANPLDATRVELCWSAATANLTPAGELKTFDEAGFINTVRTCVNPFQRTLAKEMPCQHYKNMNDDELKALWAYISTVPATPYGQRD